MLNTIFTQFAVEGTAEKSGLAVLGVNPISLALQLVTFLILFALLKKYAFGAIVGMLEERRKTINDGIRLGREMEAEQTKQQEKIDKILHATRSEADKIIASAHSEASEIVKSAEEQAARKSTALVEAATAQIDSMVSTAKKQLESETLRLVADASAAVINEKVDASKDSVLIAKALESVK